MNNYYSYNNPSYNQNNYTDNYNSNQLFEPYAGFIRGNMFPKLYNDYKIPKPFDVEPINEQAKLLTNIDSFSFAALDLNLYLDVFPNDQNALNTYNYFKIETNELIKEYEKNYGPLTVNSDSLENYPWAWNNLPWPWDYK